MLPDNNILTVSLYLISFILHTLGFALLLQIKKFDTFGETQRLYLVNLSLIEALYSAMAVVDVLIYRSLKYIQFAVTLLFDGFLYTWYIVVMTALTFDRFLTLYLKLRYMSVWTTCKTKLVMTSCLFISFAVSIALYATHSDNDGLLSTLTIFVWPILDGAFLLVAVCFYGYLANTMKAANQVSAVVAPKKFTPSDTVYLPPIKNKQCTRKMTTFCLGRVKRGFLVPTLLISSFVLCWFIPDMIYFGHELLDREIPYSIHIDVLYPLGILIDAVIYVLRWKDTKRALKKLTKCKRIQIE